MKRLIPDSIFTRLFGLVLTALLLTHLIFTALFFAFAGDRPPPPPDGFGPARHGPPPPPPPLQPGFWLAQTLQLVLVTLAAWYSARRLVRPIHRLTHAAAQLGDNLNAPPLEESGPEETRQAARLFNHMQDKIRRQLDERSRFLAAVSHDLRTPLTRIKLRAEQLTDDGLKNRLNDDIADMAAMLDATLHYLRDESHSEPWQWLDIQALLGAISEDAAEQGQPVRLSGQAKPLYTRPSSLRRCLDNLLENALRYGERAEITLCDTAGRLVIEIRDHGPGIPENRMAAVFEPFVRLEESRNRHSGGVGLGLAIARDAAARLGGELSLANAPQGGLIARLVLPRAEHHHVSGQIHN
ncbi:MAG: HAMP domain-containing protein [Pseudogulbenkiania sp.]|nr:HAMP domain-containing protein [Pseudogulbenkiania sp.]